MIVRTTPLLTNASPPTPSTFSTTCAMSSSVASGDMTTTMVVVPSWMRNAPRVSQGRWCGGAARSLPSLAAREPRAGSEEIAQRCMEDSLGARPATGPRDQDAGRPALGPATGSPAMAPSSAWCACDWCDDPVASSHGDPYVFPAGVANLRSHSQELAPAVLGPGRPAARPAVRPRASRRRTSRTVRLLERCATGLVRSPGSSARSGTR